MKALWIGVLSLLAPMFWVSAELPAIADDFVACHGRDSRAACVYDGDTIWFNDVKIRAAGYDTPEMGRPLCPRRAAGANEARDTLLALLNSGKVSIADTGRTSYDRVIAQILVDGRDVAGPMIASGYARSYVAGEAPWC